MMLENNMNIGSLNASQIRLEINEIKNRLIFIAPELFRDYTC